MHTHGCTNVHFHTTHMHMGKRKNSTMTLTTKFIFYFVATVDFLVARAGVGNVRSGVATVALRKIVLDSP